MTNCVHCGTFIDVANQKAIFYTVKPNVYACGECHNADLNVGYDEEMKKSINAVEVFVIIVTVMTIAIIFYLVLKVG